MNLVLKLVINAAALWAAAWVVDGIHLSDDLVQVLIVAVVLALANTFIRPIIKLFSLPALILTLGLFTLVINTAILAITAAFTDGLTITGEWGGFFSAFLGALVISIVSRILDTVLPTKD